MEIRRSPLALISAMFPACANPDEKLDESQEALAAVERITESEPVNGEDLLGSEELKRQLREAKHKAAQKTN